MILPTPWYFNHKMTLDMLGIEARRPALPGRGAASCPMPRTRRALIGPRTRAIVLVTPNNPTGAVYPPARIARVCRALRRRGIALVLDETYRDFMTSDGRAA